MSFYSYLSNEDRTNWYQRSKSLLAYGDWNGWMERVAVNGRELKNCLKQDALMIEVAVSQDPWAIRYAHPNILENNVDLIRLAISLNGLVYRVFENSLTLNLQELKELSEKAKLEYYEGKQIDSLLIPSYIDIPNKEALSYQNAQNSVVEIRNSFLQRIDQVHLVPFILESPDSEIMQYMMSMLNAATVKLWLDEESLIDDDLVEYKEKTPEGTRTLPYKFQNCFGRGFREDVQIKNLKAAHDEQMGYQLSTVCIEGSNASVFKNENKNLAIVGEVSLVLSWMALKNQKAFENLDYDAENPTEESYRQVKNLAKLAAIKESYVRYEYDERFAFLTETVTEQEKKEYEDAAKKLQAEMHFTKIRMLKELAVDEIIIVPQAETPLNKELMVTPKGQVMLNDRQKVAKFLAKLKDLTTEEEVDLKSDYQQHNARGIELFDAIQKQRLEILANAKVDVKLMASTFNARTLSSYLIFSEGVFTSLEGKVHYAVKGKYYDAEGPFVDRFKEKFEKAFGITVVGVDLESGLHSISIELQSKK